MAKELPFFKFNVTEWLTGDICYESFELQGLFIRLCSEYWNRENKLSLEDANKRTREPELVKQLIEKGFIKLKKNFLKISFLDEERKSLTAKRLKLSEAGRKGGLSKAKATLKRGSSIKEVEVEIDKEVEVDKQKIPSVEEFLAYALLKQPDLDEVHVRMKYMKWKEDDWSIIRKDGKRKIKNWKSTLLNTIPYINKKKVEAKTNDQIQYENMMQKIHGDNWEEIVKNKTT